MKTIRIGGGAGYAGDRIEPALDLIRRGQLDYIIFECLAERTIALAQKDKLQDETKGYNPLLDYRMEKVIPLLKAHPVKIVTNMGAAHPTAAARRIADIAAKNGLAGLKIAAVEGDDILPAIERNLELEIMETGEKLETLKEKIVSANAYMGGNAIAEALADGADIVVTGRVADPSLVTGPLVYEFGKSWEDYDFLGKATVAGHLLECAGQVTGGYYADPGKKDVPDLWNLGFPILTFRYDGTIELEKLPGTGGLLNTHTVKEQLLYEIQNPASYFTPDVVADFSSIRVEQIGADQVRVTGATGQPRTGTLKVSVGYRDGWIGTGEISYGGRNCAARGMLAREILEHRFAEQYEDQPEEMRYDLIGMNSLYQGALAAGTGPVEVRLRAAARTARKDQAERIGKEVEALYTNGPAGGGGVRNSVTEVVSVASVLVPEYTVQPKISWFGGE